jgi:hypothetical protein
MVRKYPPEEMGFSDMYLTRAILHDENVYPDPHTFKPERWLTASGQLDPNAKEPLAFFGYGRRLCPGRHLAMGGRMLFSLPYHRRSYV